jgi:hypothetical protein
MFGKRKFTIEEAVEEQRFAAMRRALYESLWNEYEKGKKFPWPFPPMDDEQVKRDLRRILGLR